MNPGSDADSLELSRAELSRACTALWTATLSLMAAFMHTGAPAHRYLLARRIARNLAMLRDEDCFTAECRATFARLSQRWLDKAEQLAVQEEQHRGSTAWQWPGWFNH